MCQNGEWVCTENGPGVPAESKGGGQSAGEVAGEVPEASHEIPQASRGNQKHNLMSKNEPKTVQEAMVHPDHGFGRILVVLGQSRAPEMELRSVQNRCWQKGK